MVTMATTSHVKVESVKTNQYIKVNDLFTQLALMMFHASECTIYIVDQVFIKVLQQSFYFDKSPSS